MASWISSFLQSTGAESPTITAAYRLGAASQAKPNFPRDILVQFQSLKDKDLVLAAARRQGVLNYKECSILAMLDLTPESLLKRKMLKPITDQLKNKNVRFRWSPTSDLVVARNRAQYRAEVRAFPLWDSAYTSLLYSCHLSTAAVLLVCLFLAYQWWVYDCIYDNSFAILVFYISIESGLGDSWVLFLSWVLVYISQCWSLSSDEPCWVRVCYSYYIHWFWEMLAPFRGFGLLLLCILS